MTLEDALRIVINPGLALLPPGFDSLPARAMLLAIGQQEGDRFRARAQYHGGPARGFFQFERGGGVKGVLAHPSTKIVHSVLDRLQYKDHSPEACHTAIEHNDALATVFARLLLYTLPGALCCSGEFDESWARYIAAWRPGKPHRATWNEYYDNAWGVL